MTIVALRKISLVGVMEDKAAVLEAVQAFGGCHLVPLRAAQKDLEAVPSGTGREATEALRWLVDCPAPRRVVSRDPLFDLAGVVEAANRNRRALLETEDRKAALERRIRDVARWGEFTFPAMSEIGGYRFWFYEVPAGRERAVKASGAIVETVHREGGIAFMVVLSPQEPPLDSMPVPRVHIGSHALSTLLDQLEAVEIRLDDLWLERRDLTKWRLLLAENLARARDQAARNRAALETIDADRVFVMRGWARADRVPEIERLAEGLGIAALVEEPAPEDDPPTLLENVAGDGGGRGSRPVLPDPRLSQLGSVAGGLCLLHRLLRHDHDGRRLRNVPAGVSLPAAPPVPDQQPLGGAWCASAIGLRPRRWRSASPPEAISAGSRTATGWCPAPPSSTCRTSTQ
jgi:V/A-type H+-transporting ATPase subunit I